MWEHIGQIAGFGTLITIIIRWVSWPVGKILKASKARDEVINNIQKELKTNDGSSIKDAITRIEKSNAEQTKLLKKDTIRIGKVEKSIRVLTKAIGSPTQTLVRKK